jgi:hypothetical protein
MNYQPYQIYSNSVNNRFATAMPSGYHPPRPNEINSNDERFGFLGPFILGGITGGLLAPAFTPRPYYYNNYYYPPYYYYRPY